METKNLNEKDKPSNNEKVMSSTKSKTDKTLKSKILKGKVKLDENSENSDYNDLSSNNEKESEDKSFSSASSLSRENRNNSSNNSSESIPHNQSNHNQSSSNSISIPQKILQKFSDSSFKNSININKLQKTKTEEVLFICDEIFGERNIYTRKGDAINMFLRHAIKCNHLVIGEGMLDMVGMENYGFIRSFENNYSSSNDDVYVSCKKVKKYNILSGDIVTYIVNDLGNPNEKEKRLPVSDIFKINNLVVNEGVTFRRKVFDELTPTYPNQRFNLSDSELKNKKSSQVITRVVDLFSPIGKGQRGLIVAPPRSGKTTIFQSLAEAIAVGNPEVKVIILLVDERPEEVTDMKMNLGDKCKIMYSDFNELTSRHIHISEICIEHAKRLAEQGEDVVIFLDSLTRLARAFNSNAQNTGRVLSGGVDANSLQKAKRLFGAARNILEGGSITIISTCLVETGSKMDEVIFEEFKGTGNMEIVLSRYLAERDVFPALDVLKSGTRKFELFVGDEEREKVSAIRKYLGKVKYPDSVESIINKIKSTKNNVEFFNSINLTLAKEFGKEFNVSR